MERHQLVGFFLLALFSGCVVAGPGNKELGFVQKIEGGVYNALCWVFDLYPISISKQLFQIPGLEGRIVKTGPPSRCSKIILTAGYKYPPESELKKLRDSKLPVVWVIGGPGSGKGTLCGQMAKNEGFTHISVGELLRAKVQSDPDSTKSKALEKTMLQGGLIPDSASLSILASDMISKLDTSKGFLIDGFPRKLEDGVKFQEKIKPPDAIIVLEVSDEIMRKRALSRQENRKDDNEGTFNRRLKTFHKQHKLVIKNKKFSKKVRKINAERTIEKNFEEFAEIIHGLVPKPTGTDNPSSKSLEPKPTRTNDPSSNSGEPAKPTGTNDPSSNSGEPKPTGPNDPSSNSGEPKAIGTNVQSSNSGEPKPTGTNDQSSKSGEPKPTGPNDQSSKSGEPKPAGTENQS
ncbi:uncharacterized protein LOC129000923 [Macrosteles quadrilineatus]|uniref:uncharacterized protein LOC129000923 n=1 Tax=Macrosteles quadrilineatus TaxID=74068 RepID=UPI0023E0B5B0|nr:uncharacterized protein LOC129000923 [Macrosteles quadrilineatus]